MNAVKTPRCGKRIRDWKVCGRAAGHSGQHSSEEAYRRQMDRAAERRAEGLKVITIHGYGGYCDGCRCEVCKAAKADYMRKRRDAANEAAKLGQLVPGSLVHGSRYAYEERGCRCAPCCASQASRHAKASVAA